MNYIIIEKCYIIHISTFSIAMEKPLTLTALILVDIPKINCPEQSFTALLYQTSEISGKKGIPLWMMRELCKICRELCNSPVPDDP